MNSKKSVRRRPYLSTKSNSLISNNKQAEEEAAKLKAFREETEGSVTEKDTSARSNLIRPHND